MIASARPVPVPDRDSAPFWEGCRCHELLLQRCSGCGALRFPPAPLCELCRAREHLWEPHSGRGEVYSWVIVHHAPSEAFADAVPYVVALIDLAPGVRMPSNLIGCDPAEIKVGLPVQVTFQEVAPGVTLPLFEPVDRVPAAVTERSGDAHA